MPGNQRSADKSPIPVRSMLKACTSGTPASAKDEEDNGEGIFLDEDDVINEYDVDAEELPDAYEEGGSDGEENFDEIDDSIHTFTGHKGEVFSVACSPTDGSLVATGGIDNKGFLWKIGQGDWEFVLQDHNESVSSLSFSADGQLLASGSLDGVVNIWDMTKEVLKCTLHGPSEGIAWLSWHPKEHWILAGFEEDSSVWMWETDMGDCPKLFTGHAKSVTCGEFTPDGKTICSGSDDVSMRIWNLETGGTRVVKGHDYHTKALTCLTINSESTLALSGSIDGSVHLVKISNGKVLTPLNGHSGPVECAAFGGSSGKDNNWKAATGGMDKKLIIWDQHSSPHPRCTCKHEENISCLVWLPGSRYIATGCVDGKVWLWDSLSGVCVKVFSGHSDIIQSIAVSSNGDFLVSASSDGTARVFELP